MREVVEEFTRIVLREIREKLRTSSVTFWIVDVDVSDVVMLLVARRVLEERARDLITEAPEAALRRMRELQLPEGRELLKGALKLSEKLGLAFNGIPIERDLMRALMAWSRVIESWFR